MSCVCVWGGGGGGGIKIKKGSIFWFGRLRVLTKTHLEDGTVQRFPNGYCEGWFPFCQCRRHRRFFPPRRGGAPRETQHSHPKQPANKMRQDAGREDAHPMSANHIKRMTSGRNRAEVSEETKNP